MKQHLRAYISEELFTDAPCRQLHDDENLFVNGIIGSMGLMRLVMFIEERWALSVPHEDMTAENFTSINAISQYLERRVGATGATGATRESHP